MAETNESDRVSINYLLVMISYYYVNSLSHYYFFNFVFLQVLSQNFAFLSRYLWQMINMLNNVTYSWGIALIRQKKFFGSYQIAGIYGLPYEVFWVLITESPGTNWGWLLSSWWYFVSNLTSNLYHVLEQCIYL